MMDLSTLNSLIIFTRQLVAKFTDGFTDGCKYPSVIISFFILKLTHQKNPSIIPMSTYPSVIFNSIARVSSSAYAKYRNQNVRNKSCV